MMNSGEETKKKKILILKPRTVVDKINDKVNDEVKEEVTDDISKPSKLAQHVCIKVENLRKIGYEDLEQWLGDPDNHYVGRRGRIFITDPKTKQRRIFHYPDNKWKNPYKVDNMCTLEESLKSYREYLDDSGLIKDVGELRGKNLGCFCAQNARCHAKMLAELANNGEACIPQD